MPAPGQPPGPGPVEGGKYGGRIVVGYATPPDSNDPAQAEDYFSYDLVTGLVFSGGLLAYGGQGGGPVGNLADMPEVSQDRTSLMFALKPEARFHNGREITSEDVKYSWERVLMPSTTAWGSSYFKSVIGASEVIKGQTRSLEGFEIVDSRTFKIGLVEPDFTFLNVCCLPFSSPVPKEEVERLGADFAKTPVGYGPFMIDSYDEGAQAARLVRFDDYLWSDLPYLDEVEMRWGASADSLLLQIKDEAIDITGDGIRGTVLGQATSDRVIDEMLVQIPVLVNYVFEINVGKPPLDSAEVRQALNWAINREDLAKILHGAAEPHGKPYPPGIEGYTSTFEGYTYDPTRARQLLQDAGLGGGFELELTANSDNPDNVLISQVVAQNLEAVGISVEIQPRPFAVYSELASQGELDMWPIGWFMTQPTPADKVDNQWVTDASSNLSGYSNQEVDALAREATSTFDEVARNDMYARIEELIGEDSPALFMLSGTYNTAVNPRVSNFHFRGELGNYYDRIWIE